MIKRVLLAMLLAAVPARAQTRSQWTLEQSTLTYHVSHALNQVDGVSHAAQGTGTCHDGECDFLITVPVNTFDSANGHRDRHMLRVTHGEQFPTITVRTRLPESATESERIHADLEIQFAGQIAEYKQVTFQQVTQGNETRISGTIPTTLADFKIDPPSLFTMAIRNEIPVRVDMTWKKEK
ncbi:MAG: YceI family protein [Candidatus Acidiferrales bacterium]